MDRRAALALCNPEVPLDTSLAAARDMMRSDPLLDIHFAQELLGRDFAQELLDREGGCGSTISLNESLRALEILDALSVGNRLVLQIGHLAHHSEPRLRSKVVILIGRRVRNIGWIEQHLEEERDARVQANIIESLWGLDLRGCEEIFLRYRNSPDHRVAGNAVYGLYQRGHPEARAAILAMAGHSGSLFRRAAAWIIGKTGDVELREILRPLLIEADPKVRNSAHRALALIKGGLKK
jgi:HEAT repeat protein